MSVARLRLARLLLLFEAATFMIASAIHFGALLEGYGHTRAGTAEAVIGAALFLGLAVTWLPSIGLRAFIGAQIFATFGVLVGLFTIAVGVGPRTVLDVAYHVFILAVLGGGLALALNVRVYPDGVQYIALLRGINLGAHNKVSMAYLRDLFAALGGDDVSTYVQSGNVLFKSSWAPSKMAQAVEERLELDLGLEVPVIVRSRAQLAKILRANPFAAAESEPTKLHVTFLAGTPDRAGARVLKALEHGPDRFHIVGREIFAHLPNGYAGTKLTNALFEKHLRVTATSRNWRTVTKLAELAGASGV